MRFETISPSNHGRIKLMAESAVEAYDTPPLSALFYIGMFSDAVRQRTLTEQRQAARKTIVNVLGTHYDYTAQIKIIECLMLFSYLCGWHGADKTFQQSLHKMKLNETSAA